MLHVADDEQFKGLGKSLRQQMKKRWRQEGGGKSLKEWAREALVGDAAAVWIASKQGQARERTR